MFGGVSAPFTVVYSDADREINVGTVLVDHSLNFKNLLSLLSQRIGISPHQFNVYLAAFGSDRRIPVTAKFNLAAIPRDGIPYFFLVERTRRSKKNLAKRIPPENAMCLRRDFTPLSGPNTGATPPVFNLSEYDERLRNFRMEWERFVMSMATDDVTVRGEASNGGSGGMVCEECSRIKLTGIDDGFHLCLFDKVTVGFRSSAGPITRSASKSGEVGP